LEGVFLAGRFAKCLKCENRPLNIFCGHSCIEAMT
jgi:hypothetical protein